MNLRLQAQVFLYLMEVFEASSCSSKARAAATVAEGFQRDSYVPGS